MTQLKCSLLWGAFPTCPHSLGKQIFVVGLRHQVLMIQKSIVRVTHWDTVRGPLETRRHYQGSKAEVPNTPAPECSTSMWRAFLSVDGMKGCSQDGWVMRWGHRRSHGAPLGANKSSCGEIPCSATRNVTPTSATGLGAGTTKAQDKGLWLKMNQVRSWPRSRQGEQGLVGAWSRCAEPHPQGTRGDSSRVTEGVSRMPASPHSPKSPANGRWAWRTMWAEAPLPGSAWLRSSSGCCLIYSEHSAHTCWMRSWVSKHINNEPGTPCKNTYGVKISASASDASFSFPLKEKGLLPRTVTGDKWEGKWNHLNKQTRSHFLFLLFSQQRKRMSLSGYFLALRSWIPGGAWWRSTECIHGTFISDLVF